MAVDPRSGEVKGQWPLHQPGLGVFSSQGWGAKGIAFARNSVWATVGVSGLVRVSPAHPRVDKHYFVVGPDPRGGVTATQGAVWVNILGPAQLVEIDPTRNSIVHKVNVGTSYGTCNLAGSGQTVWAPATGEGSSTTSGIWRIDAVRLVFPRSSKSAETPAA